MGSQRDPTRIMQPSALQDGQGYHMSSPEIDYNIDATSIKTKTFNEITEMIEKSIDLIPRKYVINTLHNWKAPRSDQIHNY